MTRSQLRGAALVATASLAVASAVAWLVGAWNPEETILRLYHAPLAAWLQGGAEPRVVTYPMWGYAALLALASEPLLHGAQLVAASAAAGLVWLCAAPRIGAPRWLAALLVLGVPWHALAVSLWSSFPAALCSLLALLVVGRALERPSAAACALGGALFGLAANFRSEAIATALAVPIAAATARAAGWSWGRPWHASLALATALLALVPWALHVQRTTGHYGLTSSNGGMVALISLGQLPGNPWGIDHHDSFASEWLARHGSSRDPFAPENDRTLRQGFQAAIREHPGAYARKLLWNLRSAAIGGLYVGQIVLPPDESQRLDAFREDLKQRVGLNPNRRQLPTQQGVEPQPPSGRALGALAWQASGVVLGAAFLWLGAAGLVLARRLLARDAVLALFAAAIATQLGVMAALQYLPRHATSLYPLAAPFAALALARLAALLRRAPAQASQSSAGSSS
jgi:hypothetical protein